MFGRVVAFNIVFLISFYRGRACCCVWCFDFPVGLAFSMRNDFATIVFVAQMFWCLHCLFVLGTIEERDLMRTIEGLGMENMFPVIQLGTADGTLATKVSAIAHAVRLENPDFVL